jgi:hypothetical protein
MTGLTPAERALLDALSGLWNAFAQLPQEHRSDGHEASEAIHRLQDMIAARPGYRAMAMQAQLEQRAQEKN